MRHLQRLHDVSIKWLKETFERLKHCMTLSCCKTEFQAADIFTKPFDNKAKYHQSRGLIGIGVYRKPVRDTTKSVKLRIKNPKARKRVQLAMQSRQEEQNWLLASSIDIKRMSKIFMCTVMTFALP